MGILELLLPPACAGCARYGAILCARCVGTLRPARSPRHLFSGADPGIVVGEALDLAFAAFVHEGALRRALQRLKYGGAGRLAAPLAAASWPALADLLDLVDGQAVLVPVPVHAERRRARGYNQAALLAAELGSRVGLPVRDILERTRPTAKQHGLGRAARLRRGAASGRRGASPGLRRSPGGVGRNRPAAGATVGDPATEDPG